MLLMLESRPDLESGRFSVVREAHAQPGWTYDSTLSASSTPESSQRGHVAAGESVLVPVSALAEAHDTEASTTGRSFEDCRGASAVFTGIGPDPTATFTGVFRASRPGAAHKLLQGLAARIKEGAIKSGQPKTALPAALACSHTEIESCEGLTGCAVLFTKDSLAFYSLGDCLLALGKAESNSITAINLCSRRSGAPSKAVTLGSVVQQAKSAFGSLIPVDRASTVFQSPESVQPAAVQGVQEISDNHHFLVLGAGAPAAAMPPSSASANVQRSRERASDAGQSAAFLAAECLRTAASSREPGKQGLHVTVAVLHFKPPALPFKPLRTLTATSEGRPESPATPPRCAAPAPTGLPPLLLSPSGRRVHFLPPVQGSEVAPSGGSPGLPPLGWTPFNTAGERSHHSESDGSGETGPSGGFPEGSSLLSSGSQLSQPNMSIPEEDALPGEHSAMQLPPPLLAPVRKAYPSGSGEFRIPPELLSSPSPGRKAKIGRAASVNSPEGLWPHDGIRSQRSASSSLAGQATGSSVLVLGSRSRGRGEEGRVRGGMPRASSVPTLFPGVSYTPSPTASNVSSPYAAPPLVSAFAETFDMPENLPRKMGQIKLALGRAPGSNSLGHKTRGQSAALRILQASGCTNASSAPADLERLLTSCSDVESSSERKLQLPSSGTESVELASEGSSGGHESSVRCLPPLSEGPALPARLSISSEGADYARSVQGAACTPGGEPSVLSSAFCMIPVSDKGFRRVRSEFFWPPGELDSAAGAGLLCGRSLEGRQHSGRAFSSSSLADSAGSLNIAAAVLESCEHST